MQRASIRMVGPRRGRSRFQEGEDHTGCLVWLERMHMVRWDDESDEEDRYQLILSVLPGTPVPAVMPPVMTLSRTRWVSPRGHLSLLLKAGRAPRYVKSPKTSQSAVRWPRSLSTSKRSASRKQENVVADNGSCLARHIEFFSR